MAGLCEGGNEPLGQLKAICNTVVVLRINVNRFLNAMFRDRWIGRLGPVLGYQNHHISLLGFLFVGPHGMRVTETGRVTEIEVEGDNGKGIEEERERTNETLAGF
ncbi:hypothetical protein ANN_08343 [Periplaneta americana]|uniref:Uncharacterized protein n=1 Tax=Periplaneta americana TaxID=6978 RepID=A0ABQ8T149_PERAM|nr:hypothetical protein ANN_08343 [Periplaneta americana]